MAQYFAVQIADWPTVAYEEHGDAGVRFLDTSGADTGNSGSPAYTSRHWVPSTLESWMIADPVAPTPDVLITTKAFLLRFTQAERIGIRTAAKTSVVIEDWLRILESDTVVHLNSQFTVEGITALVQNSFLTQARADQISTTPPADYEVPRA